MEALHYFDYETVAKQAAISPTALSALRIALGQDYPKDEMMLELRLLRICSAIKAGHITLEQHYDPTADTLNLSFGHPESATTSKTIDPNITVRYVNSEIVGLTVLHPSTC